MITVWMMEVTIDQIVHVIAVRDRLMTTARSVLVFAPVSAASVLRSAGARIGRVYRDGVFVDMAIVHVVEMPVMQIVDMPTMTNGRMAAIGSMLVRMVRVAGFATSVQFLISLVVS